MGLFLSTAANDGTFDRSAMARFGSPVMFLRGDNSPVEVNG